MPQFSCGFAARCAEGRRPSAMMQISSRGYAPAGWGIAPGREVKSPGKSETCRTSGGRAAILGLLRLCKLKSFKIKALIEEAFALPSARGSRAGLLGWMHCDESDAFVSPHASRVRSQDLCT